MRKLTTEELEVKIDTNWDSSAISYYFAQVLSGGVPGKN